MSSGTHGGRVSPTEKLAATTDVVLEDLAAIG